jgi:hypothetical protein
MVVARCAALRETLPVDPALDSLSPLYGYDRSRRFEEAFVEGSLIRASLTGGEHTWMPG